MNPKKINRRDFLKLALAGAGTYIAAQIGARFLGIKHSPAVMPTATKPDWTTTPAPSLTKTLLHEATPTGTATAPTPPRVGGVEIEQRIKGTRIPVIEYHYIGYSAGGVSETEELFRAQMDFFQLNGFKTITDVDLGKFLRGEAIFPAKVFVIRIDQGAANFQEFEKMLNIIAEKGFSALVYVISGEQYSDEQWRKFANWYQQGLISLGSHSITHPDFKSLEYSQAYDEAVYSRRAIQDHLAQFGINKEIISFAFPFDSIPDNIDFIKAAGYEYVLGGNLFGVADNAAREGQYLVPSLYPYVMQSLLEVVRANRTNNQRALSLTCGYPFDEMIYMNSTPITLAEIRTVIGAPYPEKVFGEFREIPVSDQQERTLVRPVGIIIHTDDQGGNWFDFWNTGVTYDSLLSNKTDVHFAVDRHGIAQFLRMYPDFCTPARGTKGFMDYISIEMCGREYNQVLDPKANVEKVTVIKEITQNTIGLVKTLIEQYGIIPANVLGHYQATASGKTDPGREYMENYFLPLLKKTLG
jgi:hypothetical protein